MAVLTKSTHALVANLVTSWEKMDSVGPESAKYLNKIEIARHVSTTINLNQVIVSVSYIHVLHLNATWMTLHPMVSL